MYNLIFAGDWVLSTSVEDRLQCSVCDLQTVAPKYNTRMSPGKLKVMVLRGKEPVPGRVINNDIL